MRTRELRARRRATCRSLPIATLMLATAITAPGAATASTDTETGAAIATTAAVATTTCPNPAADVVVEPGDDLAAVARAHPEGTRFRLAPGVHFADTIRPKARQSFLGSYGPDCERVSILDGSRRLRGWQQRSGLWVARGIGAKRINGDQQCTTGFGRCNEPHDVFLDNVPLRHATSMSAIGDRAFFYRFETNEIFMRANPTGRTVTISAATNAFRPSAPGVRIAGLVIRKYATPPKAAAVIAAPGWTIVDNEIALNHSGGLNVTSDNVVRRNWIHDNGQIGVRVYGDGAVLESNIVTHNNYARFLGTWGAGGIKIIARNVRAQGNCVADNEGAGIWADVDSRRIAFVRNTVFGNWTQGIFFEVSSGAEIRENIVGQNGRRTMGLYGSQIFVSTSSNALVIGNVVEVNARFGNGIGIVWQERGGNRNALDNVVRGNDVTFLGASGGNGMRENAAAGDALFRRSTFSLNRYHSPQPGWTHFWGARQGPLTLTQMKATGQEAGSTIDANVRPRVWTCDALASVQRG